MISFQFNVKVLYDRVTLQAYKNFLAFSKYSGGIPDLNKLL